MNAPKTLKASGGFVQAALGRKMKVPPEWRQTPPKASGKMQKRTLPQPVERVGRYVNSKRNRLSGSLRRRRRSRYSQVSAPDVEQLDLTSGMQQHQVGNPALELHLTCSREALVVSGTHHRCACWCCGRSTILAEHSPHHRRACSSSSCSPGSDGSFALVKGNCAGNARTPCIDGTGRMRTPPSRLPGPRPRPRRVE